MPEESQIKTSLFGLFISVFMITSAVIIPSFLTIDQRNGEITSLSIFCLLFILLNEFYQIISLNHYYNHQKVSTIIQFLFLVITSAIIYYIYQDTNIYIGGIMFLLMLHSVFLGLKTFNQLDSLFYPVLTAITKGVLYNILLFYLSVPYLTNSLMSHFLPISGIYFLFGLGQQIIYQEGKKKSFSQKLLFISILTYLILYYNLRITSNQIIPLIIQIGMSLLIFLIVNQRQSKVITQQIGLTLILMLQILSLALF